ncbi:MAG: hypothetical protein WDM78_22350 [Puia sp.]
MIYGGIYDQLAGGFARYSTDEDWLAPHFEKMLYDNALIIIAMCEAFQMTQKPNYSRAIRETMDFIQNELYSKKARFIQRWMRTAKAKKENITPGQKVRFQTFWGRMGMNFAHFMMSVNGVTGRAKTS